jgi:hypothetical protein
MDQLLQEQHAQTGTAKFSEKELKDTLGGILSFIKSKVGAEHFEKIQSVIPQAGELVTKAETNNSRAVEGGGGASNLLSSAMNMLDSAGGGATSSGDAGTAAPVDSMTRLLGYLGKMGIDPKQAMAFLPVVAKFLKEKAGVDVSSLLGTGGSSSTTGATAAPATGDDATKTDDMVGNIMNQASGFMSSFSKK